MIASDPVVLIAAGGRNERWGVPGIKVLAEVDGEPLVGRTVRMCRERKREPRAVSGHGDVLDAVDGAGYSQPWSGSVSAMMADCADLWSGERVALLLGDVWYVDGTLSAALDYRGLLVRAWGSDQEVYAVAWAPGMTATMMVALATAAGHGGKLWHLLRVLDGLYPTSHARLPSMLQLVDDGTRDFDSREQFDAWTAGRF